MRLRELRLERFGHFSDCCHDFGEGGANADFHIILGPNESGKTTTMMGYLALLYGFERRNEPYAFRHERRNLSVSALLEFDGEVRQFTRVGGSKPDLRDAAGKPVPDYVLEDIIGNLSRDGYEKLFCLDDSTIEQGGKEIVNADGEMGKLLFGAMAGVSELSKVLDTARDEAVAMYRKSGKSRMRELKKEFNQLKREIGELDVSPAALGNMRSALAGAKTRLADAESKRQSLQQERASLSVKHKVLPLFAELDQLRARLATAEHLPHPLPIERDTLFEWQQERKQVVKQLEGLTQEIDELKARHADISIDAEALKLEKALRELEPLRSRCVIDADKLPTLASERDAAESDLLRALAELGVDADADVAGFICSPADIADLEALAAAYREAESLHAAEVKHLAECETELDTARLALAEFERHEHADMAIAELLEHFDAERLASEVAVAQSSIADAAEHWRAALDGLAIKGVNFSEVPDAPLDLAAAEALAARHDELGKRIDQARDSLDDLDSKTALVEAHIASMREDTGLASDDDVSAARKARDALWQRHIDSLDADTAARFHAAMLDVDRQMLDRLRQAEALGRLRELERSLEPHRVGIAREKQRLAELQRERQSIETRADDAADAVGISGLSPTGLLRWLQQHAEALDAGQRHRRVLDSHAATMERADALLAALREALGLQHLDFKGALDRARREASAAREQHSTIRERTAMIANLERQRDRKHGELSECTAARDAAGAAWEARVDTLFGGAVAPASLLPSLGTLHRLRQYEERRIVSVRELDRLVSERQRFSTAIHALGDRFELRHDDDMQLFEELEQLAHEAAASRQSRETLETEIAKRAEEHAAATEERERVEQNIADVAAQFPPSVPTDSPEALLSAFDKALDAIAQRKRVDELEMRIAGELSLADMNAVRNMLAGLETAALEASIANLDTDIERLNDEIKEAASECGSARSQLDAITADDEVARRVERMAAIEEEMASVAEDYLELELGHRLASEAIRRYRDAHRSTMMAATEDAFAELTDGAYLHLRSQPEKDREILLAMDGDGNAKRVNDLSKGTRFQLYLALRAAAHEHYVANKGISLPFFCDDIFETFDDQRTRAACRLMERIGRRGQAIYLTHHRHVVDIAREVCESPPRVTCL